MPRFFRSTALIALLASGLAVPALAQSQATTGVIEGTVLDESNAPVPGASVTIRNTATNFERAVNSDAEGRFRGLLLPLGPYRVTVALPGFATLVRDGITLAVGQTVNLDLKLKVSTVQEEVVVTGAAPAGGDDARGGLGPHRRRGHPRPAQQRAQLPRLHEAHPRREHRAGAGRGRADHQRPEGDRQQHLGGRRRLQQPVLRRAARRTAPALHLQHGRDQGSGRGGGGRARGVRAQQRRVRQRRDQVRDQRPPRHRARLLQEPGALVRAQARATAPPPPRPTSTSSRPASPWAGRW